MTHALACAFAALIAMSAFAAPARAAGTQAEVAVAAESLGSGFAPWREAAFALRHEWAPRAQIELNLRSTERFDRRDEEIGIGLSAPVFDGWNATFAASVSPSHAVLARSTLGVGVGRALGDGWVLGGALRSTRYEHDRANAASATLERYFGSPGAGDWRASATVVTTCLVGVATSAALRLQLDRYVGERGRVGLLLAGGREVENLGAGALLVADVSSVAVTARWPIAPAWSLVGELGRHRFGSHYVRSAGRLGVQLDY